MLFLCSAKGHVLKGRQGLFQKLTVDLVCRDGLINSDQLKDQVVIAFSPAPASSMVPRI